MDSNSTRLYYLFNDGNVVNDLGSDRAINSESRNLLNISNNNVNHQNIGANSAATLEVSSTTIINARLDGLPNSNIGNDVNHNSNKRIDEHRKSVPSSNEIQMEYHFNPLYIISDRNTEHEYETLNQIGPSNRCFSTNSIYDHQLYSSPPSDYYSMIYLSFIMAGIGFQLPYQSFMIALDHFKERFPNTTIIFDISNTYMIFALITVIVNSFLVDKFSFIRRLKIGYSLSFIFMIIAVVYEIVNKSVSYNENLVVISFIAIGCTVQQSTFYGYTSMLPKRYIQAVMIGESAARTLISISLIINETFYHQQNPQQDSPTRHSTFFLYVSVIVILICAIIHIIFLPRSDFIRYHIFLCSLKINNSNDGARIMHQINENVGLVNMYHNQQENNDESSHNHIANINGHRPSILSTESINNFTSSFENNNNIDDITSVNRNNSTNKIQNILRTDSTEFVLPFGIDDEEIIVETSSNNQRPATSLPVAEDSIDLNLTTDNSDYSVSFKSSNPNSFFIRWFYSLDSYLHFLEYIQMIFRLLRRFNMRKLYKYFQSKYLIRKNILLIIWPYATTIMLVHFVSAIFPGIEWEIHYLESWFPIIWMTTFDLTDFLGKLTSSLFFNSINRNQLLMVSLSRFLLIPLFFLSINPRFNPFSSNPFCPILFLIVLGLTNGIFGSLPMILAPFRVNEQMREITGNLMTFSYVIGLTSGSFAFYALNDWMYSHNK